MNTTKPLILAIDNGTQSVRALLFDTQGNLVGKGKQEIEPYFSEQPGWAEQHPEYFWENLGKACQLLWKNTDALPTQVAGVTLTTQRGTVVNHSGQPSSGSTNVTPGLKGLCPVYGAGCSSCFVWNPPLIASERKPRPTGLPRTNPGYGRPPGITCCCRAT